MNFFAHAVIASRIRPEPRFVLGSMLPDLAGMAGIDASAGDVCSLVDVALAEGVRFHGFCDDVFHSSRAFGEIMLWSRADLKAHGLPRGPTLAASHVGAELLLDGWLAEDCAGLEAYHEALALLDAEPSSFLDPWLGSNEWRRLAERLRDGTLPKGYRAVEFVAELLERILARRPRLRLDRHGAREVRRHLPALRQRVGTAVPELVDEVLDASRKHLCSNVF
jgi:hypothetical protein